VATLAERIENRALLSKVMPVEEAVKLVRSGETVAVSGFTKSGEPKAFLPALARHFAEVDPSARINLLTGASLSSEVEDPVAPFIQSRGPYMSSAVSRKLIHAGKMDFMDVHLALFARNLMYGFYGDIHTAVIEVSRVRPNGSVVLTNSVGVSAEALLKARQIILEVNTAGPDYTGFHDIVTPSVHPTNQWPIPITDVIDRVGAPYVEFDTSKVVAVVESRQPDYPVPFKETSDVDRRIAQNVIEYLLLLREKFHWAKRLPPIQSGVGNIANAVVGELYNSPFQRIRFWTEVFQDGMLRFVEDEDKFDAASATAISLSAAGLQEFNRIFARCRNRVVLRPMWISNLAELITRLFVIAMNTPVEVDIYGHANSTHIDGSRIVNGIGGSGDFLRNAYVSILHTPSTRTLRDGRTVSCVMPYVRHIDHTEHDVKCIVTEQGFATNTDIRSGKSRAVDIIERCAHPYFRPLLRDYLKLAGGGDEPRPTNMDVLTGWWKEYDAACRTFPAQAASGR